MRFYTAALAQRVGMGEVGLNLSCLCQVCLTWRRLGAELARGHANQGYQGEALLRLRWAFNELIDYREANHIALGPPVAVGGPSPIPPAVPEEEGPAVERGSENRAGGLEGRPPEAGAGEEVSEEKKVKTKKKDKKEHRRGKDKEGKTEFGEGRSRSRKRTRRETKTPEKDRHRSQTPRQGDKRPKERETSAPSSSRRVKEEPSESELAECPLGGISGEASPVRSIVTDNHLERNFFSFFFSYLERSKISSLRT